MSNSPDEERVQRTGEGADKLESAEISGTSETCPQPPTPRPARAQALQDVYDEAERCGVQLLTDADPEIKAYMDNAAKREGVPPEGMHAITLGATIGKAHGKGAAADVLALVQDVDLRRPIERRVTVGIGVHDAIGKAGQIVPHLGIEAMRGIGHLTSPGEQRRGAGRLRRRCRGSRRS